MTVPAAPPTVSAAPAELAAFAAASVHAVAAALSMVASVAAPSVVFSPVLLATHPSLGAADPPPHDSVHSLGVWMDFSTPTASSGAAGLGVTSDAGVAAVGAEFFPGHAYDKCPASPQESNGVSNPSQSQECSSYDVSMSGVSIKFLRVIVTCKT